MYVDLSKAYDSIDRARLWEALIGELGLSGDTVCALQRLYSDLRVQVADLPADFGHIPVRVGLK